MHTTSVAGHKLRHLGAVTLAPRQRDRTPSVIQVSVNRVDTPGEELNENPL